MNDTYNSMNFIRLT